MQVGEKENERGWDVYEEARKCGVIIATAHDHSYGRTYPMSNFMNQTIANCSNSLNITEGRTFAFLPGLGGANIHDQKMNELWWAKIYTKTQDATHSAVFGVFNVDDMSNKAMFYFKNVQGEGIGCIDVINNIHCKATTPQKQALSLKTFIIQTTKG
ncbi:hypothetical protein B188_25920 [Candidatus Brocadiaceae bacterium B188]|nr:hypothetical protein [Candidatus Brocadia sapporoensis]QQR65826.1 MAG: hypothetical protein IPI25_09675 [Candidatus Brocadia sp.]RZV59673.1 MAG: hypothetical protein EX330_00405 [Candidatus Brocadia sp. BROELEC01]TWU50162.1 hypothetical protein B188_25920 [Candidatus Brocadiaceae bacterium B188]